MFSALRGYPDEPIGRASWAGTVKGKTKGGMLHAQGRRGKVRYHPMNGMTVLGCNAVHLTHGALNSPVSAQENSGIDLLPEVPPRPFATLYFRW